MKFLFVLIAYFCEIFDKIHIFLRIDQIRKTLHKYRLKQKKANIGKGVTIHHTTYVRNPEGFTIGDNSNVNHGSELYSAGGITIGKGTMIAYQVVILSDTRTFLGPELLKSRTERIKKPVLIGDDVWIGARAMIMPGVRIANHAIVAGGSIVTKDINEWEVVAGNPAKVIKKRT